MCIARSYVEVARHFGAGRLDLLLTVVFPALGWGLFQWKR